MVKELSKIMLLTKNWEDFAVYTINGPLMLLPPEP